MSPYVEPNPELWPPGEPIIYDLVSNIILDANAPTPGTGEDSSAADKGLAAAGGGGAANKNASAATATTTGAGAGSEKVSWLVQLHDKAMAAENTKHQQDKAAQQRGPEWLEIQDLYVQRTESETLFTRESYLMVWERRKTPGMQKAKGVAK
jgi:U4/U6.U5 tri-snRNP-associated protein 2